jgi:hypothetical protein
MASTMDDHMVSPVVNRNVVLRFTCDERDRLMADILNEPSDDESLYALLSPRVRALYTPAKITPAKKRKGQGQMIKNLAPLGPSRLSKRLSPRRQKRLITYSP